MQGIRCFNIPQIFNFKRKSNVGKLYRIQIEICMENLKFWYRFLKYFATKKLLYFVANIDLFIDLSSSYTNFL